MAERDMVRVNPEVMQGVSQAITGAATDFRTRLNELDGQIRELLANWQGAAGGAYGEAWDLWHRGASEVQQGLAILVEAVGVAGVDFQTQESASTQEVDGVYRG